jgi:polyisoprenoid-binding protein YceI
MSRSIARTLSLSLLGLVLTWAALPARAAPAATAPKAAKATKGDTADDPMDTPPGKIGFRAKSSNYTSEGLFKRWKVAEAFVPDGDITKGQVELTIDSASISDKNATLTERLKAATFFKVDKFPQIHVTIKNAKKTGEDKYTAEAIVSMIGHNVRLPCEFKVVSKAPLKIEGTAMLKRSAFDLYLPYDPKNPRSPQDEVNVEITATLPDTKS